MYAPATYAMRPVPFYTVLVTAMLGHPFFSDVMHTVAWDQQTLDSDSTAALFGRGPLS
jgi:hypothetical protein